MTSYIIKIIFFFLILVCPTTGMAQEESNDQNIGRAEKMFTFVLQDQADSLYENMSDKVKSMVQKHQLQGILKKLEPTNGAYQKHSPWEIQEIMGQKCYVSIVQFEKAKLGSVIVFDTQRKMLGIQFVPESAVKKE